VRAPWPRARTVSRPIAPTATTAPHAPCYHPQLHAIPVPSYEIVAKTADYFRAQHHCREALMDVSVGRRRFDERFDSHSADRPAVESRTAGRSRE
jgi:hypothetical protein